MNVHDLKIVSAILAFIISMAGSVPYFLDIFRRKTKPHAYTFFIWSITQGTAAAGIWFGKGGWGALSLSLGTLWIFLVFLLSLKYGTRNITKSDTIVLVLALIAILIWWQLHSPLLAVSMVAVVDLLGYIPTYRKTYEEPWTETQISWIAALVANIFSVLALSQYNALTLTYLVTIALANSIVIVICIVRRRLLRSISRAQS